MHRIITSIIVALLLVIAGSLPAHALQEASPEPGGLAEAGMPQISVNVTAEAFEGIPAEVEAGRYLVILTVEEGLEFGGGIGFIRPEGMTADEFLSALGGPADDATPMIEPEVSPEDETGGDIGGVPEFVYDALFAGGAFALAGETAQIVIDLPPGEWIAWGDDPEAPQQPVVFQVTGEMPAELPEPESNASITMSEYFIEVSEGQLQVGRNVLRIENVGQQPHFILIAMGPDDMTTEQVRVVLEEEMQAEMSGTPAAYSDLNPEEEITDVGFTGTQSTATLTWAEVMIPEPGNYVLICFFPDMEEGIPHAYLGMFTVVEVTG